MSIQDYILAIRQLNFHYTLAIDEIKLRTVEVHRNLLLVVIVFLFVVNEFQRS